MVVKNYYGSKLGGRFGKKASKMPKKIKKGTNGLKVNKPVINPVLKQYVKRAVRGTEEKKIANMEVAYRSAINGSGFDNAAAGGAYGFNASTTVVPLISQGVGPGDRIGNRIRPTSCYIRGYLRALPVTINTGSNYWPNEPFYVRVVLYRPKVNMSQNINSDILDNGNGSEGFNGELDAMLLPYNKDKFLIGYSRTFKLQAPVSSVTNAPNNDIGGLPVCKFFNIRVPMPKQLIYVDTSTAPSNCRWYLSAGIVNTSGNIAANTDIRCNVTAEAVMHYTDA